MTLHPVVYLDKNEVDCNYWHHKLLFMSEDTSIISHPDRASPILTVRGHREQSWGVAFTKQDLIMWLSISQ